MMDYFLADPGYEETIKHFFLLPSSLYAFLPSSSIDSTAVAVYYPSEAEAFNLRAT